MSGKNAGVRTLNCRYCGHWYNRTNFMKRQKRSTSKRDVNGLLCNDTHLIGCARRKGLLKD